MPILEDEFSACLREVDTQNLKRRCICCLLIDNSETMKEYSDILEQIFPAFLTLLSESDDCDNIELGVWTFARQTEEVLPIRELYRIATNAPPALHLSPHGRTHTGEAVLTALNAIDSRTKLLSETVGSHIYVPLLFTITDGNPNFTDDPQGRAEGERAWKQACAALQEGVAAGKLRAVAIGIGNRIDERNLSMLAGGSARKNVRSLRTQEDFRELFQLIVEDFITGSRGEAIIPEYYVSDQAGSAIF